MNKVAILVLADVETHGDLGRVYNALVTVKEFDEAGDDVKLISDGAATQWPGLLSAEDHTGHGAYQAVRDIVVGACGFCARAFDTEKTVREADVPMLEEYEGHPSIRSLVMQGYQVITF